MNHAQRDVPSVLIRKTVGDEGAFVINVSKQPSAAATLMWKVPVQIKQGKFVHKSQNNFARLLQPQARTWIL